MRDSSPPAAVFVRRRAQARVRQYIDGLAVDQPAIVAGKAGWSDRAGAALSAALPQRRLNH